MTYVPPHYFGGLSLAEWASVIAIFAVLGSKRLAVFLWKEVIFFGYTIVTPWTPAPEDILK